MAAEVKVPAAGESITEVLVAEWLKAEGDTVRQDEPLVTLETDKAALDLPAPASGVLTRILKPRGQTARVGEVIAILDEAAVAPDGGAGRAAGGRKSSVASRAQAAASSAAAAGSSAPAGGSPAAASSAAAEGSA